MKRFVTFCNKINDSRSLYFLISPYVIFDNFKRGSAQIDTTISMGGHLNKNVISMQLEPKFIYMNPLNNVFIFTEGFVPEKARIISFKPVHVIRH